MPSSDKEKNLKQYLTPGLVVLGEGHLGGRWERIDRVSDASGDDHDGLRVEHLSGHGPIVLFDFHVVHTNDVADGDGGKIFSPNAKNVELKQISVCVSKIRNLRP